jgi:Holliday junction resolvase RusA-like endonuclease
VILTIYIKPLAKQSCRFTKSGRKYTPADVKKAAADMRAQAERQWCDNEPFSSGVRLSVVFFFEHLKSATEKQKNMRIYKTTRPDLDNLLKNLLDSLQGVCFVNDGQICELTASKFYGPENKIIVKIEEINP